MEWYHYLIIAVSVVALVAFVIFSNNKITITQHNFKCKSAPESGIKIVHVSDLHGKSFFKNNLYLLNSIKKQSPSAIFITGDIIHKYNKRGVANAKAFLIEAIKIAPVFYVCGNHEQRYKGYEQFKEQIVSLGVTVLDDCHVDIGEITLFGVSDNVLRKGELPPANCKNFSILLAHEPQYFSAFVNGGYNLVFCGHAHGGQWRIPFTKIGLFAPGQGILPKYTQGVHAEKDTKMIVSRGLGNSEFPLRLFNCPELIVVNLTK